MKTSVLPILFSIIIFTFFGCKKRAIEKQFPFLKCGNTFTYKVTYRKYHPYKNPFIDSTNTRTTTISIISDDGKNNYVLNTSLPGIYSRTIYATQKEFGISKKSIIISTETAGEEKYNGPSLGFNYIELGNPQKPYKVELTNTIYNGLEIEIYRISDTGVNHGDYHNWFSMDFSTEYGVVFCGQGFHDWGNTTSLTYELIP